jgi:hypothetical protein
VAEKTTEDPTLLQATKIPGSPDTNDEGEIVHRFTPVTLPDGTSWVRKTESTLDWKNYRFEMVMDDGTRHDFSFTAKDDADAQKKVRERIAATQHAGGTYKLSRLEAPKELDLGELGSGQRTVAEGDESKSLTGKARQAQAKAAAAPKKRGRPSKADKEAQARAEANAKDAEDEKGDTNQA